MKKAKRSLFCSVAEHTAVWGPPNPVPTSRQQVRRENKEILQSPPALSSIEAGNALYEMREDRKVILRRKYKNNGGDGIPSYK